MFYHDNKLQYEVRVDNPSPVFAKMLQQAIGGVEGEVRVCLQYLFQAWGARGPAKYREMLLETGTEEIGHIEMLATAVALNLRNAPSSLQGEAAAKSGTVEAVLGGMDPRQYLSAGFGALCADASGVPFNGSHVYASGNIVGDMYANVTAEATGRTLACRLFNMTDDPGMKDMLRFLIARDTMHQQQWLAVIEELGGEKNLPVPDSFPQSEENQEFNYAFLGFKKDGSPPPQGRWSGGKSLDGKGEFSARVMTPHGQEANLGYARPDAFAHAGQTDADGTKSPGPTGVSTSGTVSGMAKSAVKTAKSVVGAK